MIDSNNDNINQTREKTRAIDKRMAETKQKLKEKKENRISFAEFKKQYIGDFPEKR